MPHELHDFAARYTAAWCSQDPARVADFFSDSGSLAINDGAPAVGRAQIAEVAGSFITAFPDLKITMDDLVTSADKVEYHWTLSGTNTGTGGTGRRVEISGYEQWTMGADGRLAASMGHYDAADFERQVAGR
ncbi:MAG: hypothetical protein NVS9B15_04620 [Acidobacteriaceae bacterium]